MIEDRALSFLRGGGEMGERMRAIDWSRTALGAPESWPQSLKTCVRIVLTSRQPMFVWWGKELINLYNDAYRSIVGGKHPEALGQPASIVWREIWDQVGPRAAQTMSGDEGTYDEALLLIMERHGYQEETYYTFSYSPVPNDQGGTSGIICANTEDTARVIGQRQTALVRDLATRTADEGTIEGVCTASAHALARNPRDLPFALVYLFDKERKTAILRGAAGIDPGHRAAPSAVALDGASTWPFGEALQSGMHVVTDLRALGELPTGAWAKPPSKAALVPISSPGTADDAGALVVGLNPFRVLDDDYKGFLAMVARQISASLTNARELERERQRAEALAEIDRAKTAFFSNVSHEFRTPLTLMLGPTEDALAASPPVLAGENLLTVHRNELRLLKLVNTLLDFSRIEAGRVRASYVPTDLTQLTRDLASAFRAAVERAGLAYIVDAEPLPEPVYVDHEMWEKIVLNLLSNALKFTFEGEIVVRLVARGRNVELSVRDTGIGIGESDLPKLFERFHRVEGARARTHEGSGIGLALVSELSRLHGGNVDVTSTVGKGTTFTVTIPFGTAHLPPERVNAERAGVSTATSARAFVAEALRWAGPEGVVDDAPPLSRRPVHSARIILADDNADMRDYVRRLLHERYAVETYGDGQAALEAARRNPPDLVVTDVMMPLLDGFGLLRGLRSSPKTELVPVIMLSARAGEEARVEGLEAGADDYLVKPFSARELLARVQTHLQLAKLRATAERERRKLGELLEQAPVAIAVLEGPELRYTVANEAFCELSGRSDFIGKTSSDAFPELRDHEAVASLERAYREQRAIRATEMRIPVVRAGRTRDAFFDYVAQPIIDDGASAGIIVVAIEVTEQVQARQRVEALRAAAENASRAKDEFLSTLSHELRTPLNAIVGWSALLRGANVPSDRIPSALETIERNARVQARLIDDLLDLSRIEQGKLVLSVGPVEMVRIVEAAIDAVRPACDAKGVRLQPVLDSHATIVGDPDRLQQVVWNLLSNSMKFTPRGGRIQITLHREQSYVELNVRDTGEGIDPAFLPHVFDRFRQGDPSISRKIGGLGLGLAIVRSLVELHGGTVVADSDGKGKGASFTVRLPTAPIRSDAAKSQNVEDASFPQGMTFECPSGLEGLRILVVDDEPETRELLRFVLEQCKSNVSTAANVPEALEALRTGDFQVLISDIGMPDEDGYSLLRRLRSRPSDEGGTIPALALTAYARVEDRTLALRAGFDMHMTKPIDPAELIAIVDRLVARAHV